MPGAHPIEQRFMSERELAKYAGVSTRTLQSWRFRGGHEGPPWHKLMGAVRYDLREFERWAAACPGGGAQIPEAASR